MHKTGLFLLILLIQIMAGTALGQRLKIPELPDDLYETGMEIQVPPNLQTRMKAVEFEYWMSAPYRFSTDFPQHVSGRMLREERWRLSYRVPIVLREKLNILVGHSFNRVSLFMEDKFEGKSLVGELSGLQLKGNRFSLFIMHDTQEDQTVLGAVSLSLNGNYSEFVNFDKQYRIYRGIAAYRFQEDENNDWGVGLYFKKGFRSSSILPFFTWNKTFNEKWGFEAISVIRFHMRYNHNPDNIFLMGYEYLSDDYSVNTDFLTPGKTLPYEFKWPKVNVTGKWHHRFLPVLWMEAEAGWQYNWKPSTRLRGYSAPEDNIDIESHGPVFHLGLYLSPPDEWLTREN